MERKLKVGEDEIHIKNKVISELEAQMEEAKISSVCHAQIDEISMPIPMGFTIIDLKIYLHS